MGQIKVQIRPELQFWEFTGEKEMIEDIRLIADVEITKTRGIFHIKYEIPVSDKEKADGWGSWQCNTKITIGDFIIVGEKFVQKLTAKEFNRLFQIK